MNKKERVLEVIDELKKDGREFTFYDVRVRTGLDYLELGLIMQELAEEGKVTIVE